MNVTILPARKADAPHIARAIVMAIGPEIELTLAGSPERRHLVTEMFQTLAERSDTQYSYLNSQIALAPDGRVAGVLVSYDGAGLVEMRRHFFNAAREILGLEFPGDMEPETDGGEIYLDSLAVFPEWRGRGIASRLIAAAEARHRTAGKPLGLLVDTDNPRARQLYERLGFREIGLRPFAGVTMHHMQRPGATTH